MIDTSLGSTLYLGDGELLDNILIDGAIYFLPTVVLSSFYPLTIAVSLHLPCKSSIKVALLHLVLNKCDTIDPGAKNMTQELGQTHGKNQ